MIERTGSVIACALALIGAVVSAQTPDASGGDDFEFISTGELVAANLAPRYAGYVDPAMFGQDDEGADGGDGVEAPQLQMSEATGEMGGGDYTVGDWHIWAAPYLWLPALDGDATIAGVTAEIDMSFSDIWDTFDVFAISGRTEAWKANKFGVIFDGMYLDLEAEFDPKFSKTVPDSIQSELGLSEDAAIDIAADMDVEIQQAQVDLALGWRVLDKPISPDKGEDSARIIFDAIGGARYQYLKEEVKLSGTVTPPVGGSMPFGPIRLGGSNDWVEPMIGGRVVLLLNDRWSLVVRGDTSGFGIGSASDLTWNFAFGAHYHVNQKFTLMLGYRVQGIDYKTGSGPNRFGADWTAQGIYAAGGFTF